MSYKAHVLSLYLFSAGLAYGSQQSTAQLSQESSTKAAPAKQMSSKAQISEQEALEKYEKELLDKYQPTDRNCGPTVTYNWIATGHEFGDEGSLQDSYNPEQFFVCLISGKRKVLYGDSDGLKALDSHKQLKSLVEAKQIKFLRPPSGSNPKAMLFFTPQGYEAATLLARAWGTENWSDYLMGHLLGYSEKDIYAFYMNQFEIARENFSEWISKQTKAIASHESTTKTNVTQKQAVSPTATAPSLSPELKDYEKQFLAKYNPRPDRCRPMVRAGTKATGFMTIPASDSLTSSKDPEAHIACLLSGNRQLIKITLTKPLDQQLQQLLSAKQIQYKREPNNQKNFILYTPQGKSSTELLLQWLALDDEEQEDEDQYGLLAEQRILGDTDEDIRASYIHKFKIDRENALAWIKQELPKIPKFALSKSASQSGERVQKS
jgi:hypothetical protein